MSTYSYRIVETGVEITETTVQTILLPEERRQLYIDAHKRIDALQAQRDALVDQLNALDTEARNFMEEIAVLEDDATEEDEDLSELFVGEAVVSFDPHAIVEKALKEAQEAQEGKVDNFPSAAINAELADGAGL